MKKLIYLSILFFFWGCMFEETPQEISSSSEQPRNGLALLFEQKLNARLLTRSGELEMLSDSRTPLTEHVLYGYNAMYGGHYFIVPLREENTGQIDAGLVYPLTDGDDLTLSGDLDTPLLLDEAALNAVPDSCRFLLSNKFLSWKKEGLSVARGLYAYAESLNGKVISTIYIQPSFELSSNSPNFSMRTTGDYPYEAEIYIYYEMVPYGYGDWSGITISVPSMEARRNVFVSTFEHLEFVEGVGACELTALGADYLHLKMEVAGDGVVAEAVQLLMLVSSSQFQSGYNVEISSYYYDYYIFWWDDPISGGSGGANIGGGHGGGEDVHQCPYGKCSGNPCTCCSICEGPCTRPQCSVCQTIHCPYSHIDCDEISIVTKEIVTNCFDTITNHIYTYYNNTSWATFLDTIHTNPSIEYSTSLEFYDDEGLYQLSNIHRGVSLSVQMNCGEYTRAMIHSHPVQSAFPPSPQDVLSTIQANETYPAMDIMYVYVSGDIYALKVQDTTKTLAFLQDTTIRIGPDGNFAAGTQIKEDFESSYYNDFSGMSDVEKQAFALAKILEKYNAGVQLLRKKSSEAGFSVLKAKMVEGDKYIATECK